MIRPAQLLRLGHIIRVLLRHGVDEFVEGTRVHPPLRLLKTMLLVGASSREDSPRGQRVRESLQELGPIFVKFGQAISTRRDLLPREIADELAKLQDTVPPFPADEAIAIIERAYGKPVDEVFERFDREPLAAASIAQLPTQSWHSNG